MHRADIYICLSACETLCVCVCCGRVMCALYLCVVVVCAFSGVAYVWLYVFQLVLQMGVKSAGCEKMIPHESPK